MKSPVHSSRVMWFLTIASVAWLALIHVIAFFVFGVSMLAAWAIVGGLALTFGGIIAYLAWEYRQAKPLPETPVQDVNLLMLSRSNITPRLPRHRRTRIRLSGNHPATDRIASLHRPPHLDRRVKRANRLTTLADTPFFEFPPTRDKVTPSAN